MKRILLCSILLAAISFSQTSQLGNSGKRTHGRMRTPCPGTVTYAGKIYNTVKIGSQCWLKENLDVGTMIQGSEYPTNQYPTNNDTIEKYCYNDDPANCSIYGGLYQWDEAMQYSATPGKQGICPSRWHIPTLAELQTLSAAVSGDANALKAVGQGTGTNTSGFSALLAGYCNRYGYFDHLGDWMIAWSSTMFSATNAVCLGLNGDSSHIYLHDDGKYFVFSVRCIKD